MTARFGSAFAKKHKYSAQKSSVAGYSFASKLEASLYAQLALEERAGLIKDIQVQDHIKLTDAEIVYIPDFKYFDLKDNEWVWAEAKGMETDTWRLKRRLWMYYGPGKLKVFKGSWSRLVLHEVIVPKSPKK